MKSSDEECVTGERFAQPHTQETGSKDFHYAGVKLKKASALIQLFRQDTFLPHIRKKRVKCSISQPELTEGLPEKKL